MLDFFQIDIGDVRQRVIALAYKDSTLFRSDSSFLVSIMKREVTRRNAMIRTQVRVAWIKRFDNMSIKDLESIYELQY